MRAFAGKTLLTIRRFECVPATVEHALLRIDWHLPDPAALPGVRLLVDGPGGRHVFGPLPGRAAVLAFAVPNRVLTEPGVSFRLLVGATLHPLPDPVRRHPVAEAAHAHAKLASMGGEVDRLTSRLAAQEERASRLARRHAALIGSVSPRRAPRRRLAAAAAVVVGSVITAATLAPTASAPGTGEGAAAATIASPAPAVRAHDDIPAAYVDRYKRAARRYLLDWHVLAAVGRLETGHGRWLDNPSGAAGPAQFLAGTWRRYGFDGDTDGRADVYDPDDAIPAMASYLRASGAPEDWRTALLAYNHSPRYVDQVLRLADRYRSWPGR